MGFEPTTPIARSKRLAGARTRPLCDPSTGRYIMPYTATVDKTSTRHRYALQANRTSIVQGSIRFPGLQLPIESRYLNRRFASRHSEKPPKTSSTLVQ